MIHYPLALYFAFCIVKDVAASLELSVIITQRWIQTILMYILLIKF
jgi:hypothetical protein